MTVTDQTRKYVNKSNRHNILETVPLILVKLGGIVHFALYFTLLKSQLLAREH